MSRCSAGTGTNACGTERVVLDPADRRPTVLEAIESATERVALSMFRCRDFKIMDKLAQALSRKVQVELLLTRRAKGWEKDIRSLGMYLESMGAQVHRYAFSQVKYHAKYLIVDRKLALVASLNFTPKCFANTCDFLLVTEDPQIISGLSVLFEQDVQSPGMPLPEGLSRRLIVGPEAARERFRELIRSARKSICLVDHRVTDPEMVELLKARKADGLKIKIYGKGEIDGLRSHGKAMLIDENKAVLGSISLSPPSLGARREVAVIVEDRECIAQIQKFLEGSRTPAASDAGEEEDDEDEEE